MSKRKKGTARAGTYRVLRGISNAKTGEDYQAGEVVKLGKPWNVAWLLKVNAIEPADELEAEMAGWDELSDEALPFSEEPEVTRDGNR